MTEPIQFDTFRDIMPKLAAANSLEDVISAISVVLRSQSYESFRYYRLRQSVNQSQSYLYPVVHHAVFNNSYRPQAYRESTEIDFPPPRSDRFWCKYVGKPVVVVVDEATRPPFAVHSVGKGPAHVKVNSDNCAAEDFQGQPRTCWVDVPLFIGKKFCGKLSLDPKDPNTTRDHLQKENLRISIERLFSLASMAAPFLEYWVTVQQENRLNELAQALSTCRSPPEVFEKAVHLLVQHQLFNCENADIFTFHRDSLNRRRLILRATTLSQNRDATDLLHYDLDDDVLALTEYAYMQSQDMRFTNLLDSDERARQLSSYMDDASARKLAWKETIPLSWQHRSLLLIPFGEPDDDYSGVLRLADKSSADSGFSDLDLRLAKVALTDHVIPALRSTNAMVCLDSLESKLEQLEETSNCSPSFPELVEQLSNIILGTIPAQLMLPSRGKLLVFSRVDDTREPKAFEIIHTQQGENSETVRIARECRLDRRFSLDGTLTKFVLQEQTPVYLNDLEAAAKRGHYQPTVDDAVAVISAPISFRTMKFGTVAIFSSHYDLSNLPAFPIVLKILARQVARALIQDQLRLVHGILGGVRHDLKPLVAAVQERASHDPETTNNLIHCISNVVDAHCRSKALPSDLFQKSFRPAKLLHLMSGVASATCATFDEEADRVAIRSRTDIAHLLHPGIISAILFNLVRNGLQHSPSGTEVQVVATKESKTLKISVRNATQSNQQVQRAKEIVGGTSQTTVVLDHPIDEVYHQGKGLLNSCRLAELYAVNDTNASLHVSDGKDRIAVSLLIPLVKDEWNDESKSRYHRRSRWT